MLFIWLWFYPLPWFFILPPPHACPGWETFWLFRSVWIKENIDPSHNLWPNYLHYSSVLTSILFLSPFFPRFKFLFPFPNVRLSPCKSAPTPFLPHFLHLFTSSPSLAPILTNLPLPANVSSPSSMNFAGEKNKNTTMLLPTSALDRSVHLYLRSAPTLLPLYLSHAACCSSLPLKMVTPQSLFTLFGMLSLALSSPSFSPFTLIHFYLWVLGLIRNIDSGIFVWIHTL